MQDDQHRADSARARPGRAQGARKNMPRKQATARPCPKDRRTKLTGAVQLTFFDFALSIGVALFPDSAELSTPKPHRPRKAQAS